MPADFGVYQHAVSGDQRLRIPDPRGAESTLNLAVRGLKDGVKRTDITYIPMHKGFMYLTAVMDWYSRFVLAWELSNSLESAFCVSALEQSFAYGTPEIFNTDQGAQFTSHEFTAVLLDRAIAISMDGRGRALDNAFIERLWWSVKYEDVYPKTYGDGAALYQGLNDYFRYYNEGRRHSALDKKTPAEVFFGE